MGTIEKLKMMNSSVPDKAITRALDQEDLKV